MDKPKHKTPPKNFFRYLLDEYILFRRDFVIETTASVEDCAKCLSDLSGTRLGWWRSGRVRVFIKEISDVRHFDIYSERPQRFGYTQSASAEGIIKQDDYGTTLVSGKVLMSGFIYWIGIIALGILLIIMIFILNTNDVQEDWSSVGIGFAFYGTFIIFNWLRMYLDRNSLLKKIQIAVSNAESRKITEKIKSNDIYENNNPSSMNNVR